MNKLVFRLTALATLFIASCNNTSKTLKHSSDVKVVGMMKNVMWKGQLQGLINLDSISNKDHLYGLGPQEYLNAELLVIDGKSYKSSVINDSTIKVEETFKSKAPFFAYANISTWEALAIPDSVTSILILENYLNQVTLKHIRPYLFKLEGLINKATIHIVNLPKGTEVHSPDDAHQGRQSFELQNQQASLIGFFSVEHKTIFTHHDTYLHIHLITNDLSKMGHLDEVLFNPKSVNLYISK